jgi:SAM-dependent methyltransferase
MGRFLKYQKKQKKTTSKDFWDKEYKTSTHLALSMTPSEDLERFIRWLEREFGERYVKSLNTVADLGSGNGRNLVYLARELGMTGVGFDISTQAVAQAKKESKDLPITYSVQSIAKPLPLENGSQAIVLDMMTSHFLNLAERKALLAEVSRVLRPDGWYFFKTFLLDEDKRAARLLQESPAAEKGSYIHPKIGVAEHVFTEDEIRELFEDTFIIHKIHKSHRHLAHGQAAKRRSISVYAQKK